MPELGYGHGGKRAGSGRPPGTEAVSLDARERLAQAKARLAELEVAEAEGRLVSADDAVRSARKAGAAIRNAMLNIPIRVASQLAAMTDEHEIVNVLTEAIRSELTRVADSGAKSAA